MPSWLGKQDSGHKTRDVLANVQNFTNGTPIHQESQIARIEAATHTGNPLKLVNDFVDANADAINSKSKNIADSNMDFKSIEDSLNGFSESAKVLIKGLTALGHLHPFIGIAVGAFALVVTLDMTRRDNDKKVLAVKVQMQDLMIAFFELRQIPDSEEKGPDGITIAVRLEGLMRTIANDIKLCGSVCDTYLKKGFLAKTVKSSIYEARLAEYATLFVEHRKSLELSLAMHTSLGVDSANQKLDGQGDRLRSIEEKLDMLLLFRKLDTPREKDVQKFIEDNGGAKACINNPELLEELVSKSGESLSRFSGRETGRRSNELPDIKKKLLKELGEDIDDALKRNMVLFERKLDIQSKQLTEAVQQESDHIITTLLSGAHDRITDPDLQKIWKDMGWKGSVKARHFVLALHDYYTDRLSTADTPTSARSPLPSPLPSGRASMMAPKRRQDDRWALAYINAAYVQPILEAVDDDGTGFVSVKEVNTFVAERPDGWSLPHWIAYWAVGWQASMSRYKDKIYELVQEMFGTLEHVLPSNRRAVDEYLFHTSFWRIELLLRSTRSVNPKILSDPELVKITENYTNFEEERLDRNLQDVAYELDTSTTVSLITGEGRIERYVFPLIYLLLRRHLKVITLACNHVLDTEEFVTLNESLVSILLAADHRVQNLEAIFKQTHLDVQGRLGNFAFGIFQLSYGDIRRIPIDNSFGSWTDADGDTGAASKATSISRSSAKALATSNTHEILKYGIRDGFSSTNYFEFEPGRAVEHQNPIQGTWSGHCLRREGEEVISYVLRISMRVQRDPKKIRGKGEDYVDTFEFTGNVDSPQGSSIKFAFTISDDKDGITKTCSGFLDSNSDVITAYWSTNKKNDLEEDGLNQSFLLRRTPPTLLRYRYTPDQFAEDPVRSRWSFACSAALHQVQEKLWSRRFFEARFEERKRFVELSTRALIVQMGLTPQSPLSMVEKGELEYLRRDLNPSEARFYHALAAFEIQKLPWHPSWGCDSCERRITKCRILCIQCMSEDLSDNIDLCATCVDKAPTKRAFTHDASHPVVKVEQTLHDYELSRIVDAARILFDRIKTLIRSTESASIRVEDEHGVLSQKEAELSCACCGKGVSPPCWVCVVCTRDTFICAECDSKRAPSLTEAHTFAHPLVRIRDTSIDGKAASADDMLVALEHRVLALESKMLDGFSTLDAKLDTRATEMEIKLEQRLAQIESNFETRFATLETVLRQIAAQTAALPAVYGQVVRDYARSNSLRER
ncbi:hypothetical protein BDZ94DRAFT_1322722 [Collybia nuda]|uniref:EF-hand domain-containing protein n=1 Tax=Collybia nuda TaxID=64659 RepID=A0A9P6CDY7_9AGAR|nr:hypothetical protein BDZ94DRAFT_1322722 [Collybia nuda]